MKVTREQFTDTWLEAYEGDHNMKWIADQLGMSLAMVSVKAKRLRADGLPLPELKRYRRREIGDLKNKIYKRLAS